MTPVEIRAELEQLAAYGCILAATPIDIELAEFSPDQSGVHFSLYQYENQPGVYWQGLCQEPNELAQGWHPAAADCPFSLHIERGYSVEAAVTLVYELALPVHTVIEENKTAVTTYIKQLKADEFDEQWSRLWSTDQQDIEAAVQVLPEAERDQGRYEMAFRTQPMPEQYWPAAA